MLVKEQRRQNIDSLSSRKREAIKSGGADYCNRIDGEIRLITEREANRKKIYNGAFKSTKEYKLLEGINILLSNRPTYYRVKHTEKLAHYKKPFSYNKRGNLPSNTISYIDETSKLKSWRKKAYYSLRKWIEGKGFSLDTYLFEDSFQSALEKIMLEQAEAVAWTTEHNLPLQAIINRKTRQYYINAIKHNSKQESIEQKVEHITQLEDILPDRAFLYIDRKQILEDNKEFYTAMKKQLKPITYIIACLLISGLNQKQIAAKLGMHEKSINYQTKKIKVYMHSGAHTF